MQTMVIKQFGDHHVFQPMEQPKPTLKPGHVLIKVAATSVNPFDCKLRKGHYANLITRFPMILHGDVAGVIEAVGQRVTHFKPGDDVFGCVGGLLDLDGALAEYVLADVQLIAHKPKSLSFKEAAALPLVSLTAWEGLITYAKVQPQQTLLIHGGTGGVGHMAIQLAKHLGANVFTTVSSEEKTQYASDLGADGVINYQQSSVSSYVKHHTHGEGFSVIFDTVGGDNLAKSFQAAAVHGAVITISGAGQHDLTPAFLKGLSLYMILQPLPLITGLRRAHYGKILSHVAHLVDQGVLKPLLDPNHFTLPQIGAAHDYLEQGKAIGKVVVMIEHQEENIA